MTEVERQSRMDAFTYSLRQLGDKRSALPVLAVLTAISPATNSFVHCAPGFSRDAMIAGLEKILAELKKNGRN